MRGIASFPAVAAGILVGGYLITLPFRSNPPIAQAQDTSKPSVDASNEYRDKIEPPGSLFSGCRIEWGAKICGEKAALGRSYTSSSQASDPTIIKPREPEHNTCYATLAKFRRIQLRMSQAEVNNIMRCEGELISEVKVYLYPTRTFGWRSRDGEGYATVVYWGHQVRAIRQEGLP